MHTYAELDEYLSKGRSKDSRPWPSGKHTQIHRLSSGEIAVKLHSTDVVVIRPDNSRVLNSGGWKTVTTKERINEFMPKYTRVQTDKGIWNVYQYDEKWSHYYIKTFVDGMVISPDGKTEFPEGSFPLRNEASVRRQIDKFASDFTIALLKGRVSAPSAGDCWYCSMRTVEEHKPLGEVFRSSDHILFHIKEHYYVPSLLVNAIEAYPVAPIVKSVIAALWQEASTKDIWARDLVTKQVTSSLRRYLRKCLGLVI